MGELENEDRPTIRRYEGEKQVQVDAKNLLERINARAKARAVSSLNEEEVSSKISKKKNKKRKRDSQIEDFELQKDDISKVEKKVKIQNEIDSKVLESEPEKTETISSKTEVKDSKSLEVPKAKGKKKKKKKKNLEKKSKVKDYNAGEKEVGGFTVLDKTHVKGKQKV